MAKDKFHDIVKLALEKDGWTITHDPLRLLEKKEQVLIDLGAEKIIIAEKDAEKIAVEVKSFTKPSIIYSFHEAIGQYINYLSALKIAGERRDLYLAVTEDAYISLENRVVIMQSLKDYQIKILIFDLESKNIIKWIK